MKANEVVLDKTVVARVDKHPWTVASRGGAGICEILRARADDVALDDGPRDVAYGDVAARERWFHARTEAPDREILDRDVCGVDVESDGERRASGIVDLELGSSDLGQRGFVASAGHTP